MKQISQRIDWGICAALALALPLIVPFVPAGLPVIADAELHFYRLVSAAVDLQAGYLWPRWSPYLHLGYGYPIHNFYAPGMHILGAIVFLLTHIDPTLILKTFQFSATVLYPLGAYCFCRIFASRAGALVAAAAYTFAPFRFHELWAESNFSQLCAMALMAWLLWAIARGVARPTLRRMALIGLLYGAIVVLHHPTAFLFTPFAGLYALGLSLRQVDRQAVRVTIRRAFPPLAVAAGGLVLGLALSAIFWLPALLELNNVQISRVQSGSLSIAENFVALRDLASGVGPVDRTALSLPSFKEIGQPQIVVAALGLLVFLPRVRSSWALRFNVIAASFACVLCVFLITPASAAIWSALPVARFIEYPWRLLGIVAIGVLPGAAVIPSLLPLRAREPLAGAAIILFFVAILPSLYAPITFAPSPAPTEAGANDFEAHTGDVGLVSDNEYLPKWAVERPLGAPVTDTSGLAWSVAVNNSSLPQGASANPAANCQRGSSCYEVNARAPFDLIFHQMYFPGWQATVGGNPVEPVPTGPSGLLTVRVPAGESRVTIWYGGTTVQTVGTWLSIAGLLLSGLLLLVSSRFMRAAPPTPNPSPVKREGLSLVFPFPSLRGEGPGIGGFSSSPTASNQAPSTQPERRLGQWVTLAVVGFVVINQLWIDPHTTLFRRQSDPGQPPASHTVHAVFGDTLELLGYDLESPSAAAGQAVRVTLYWRVTQPTNLALSVAVHLTGLNGRGDWGGVSALNPGDLSTDVWPTDRYAVNTLRFNIAPNAPPYVGELRVSVFKQPGIPTLEYLKDSSGQNSFALTSFRVAGTTNAVGDFAPLRATNINFGNAITLAGYQFSTNAGGQQCILLRWEAQADGTSDDVVMLHVLNPQNQMLNALDAPPLDGLYPTSAWRKDQVLYDTHCFDRQPGMTTLLLGLYRQADTTRLTASTATGDRLPDDGATIALP